MRSSRVSESISPWCDILKISRNRRSRLSETAPTDRSTCRESEKVFAIREDGSELSNGTFQVQRFPAPDPAGVRDTLTLPGQVRALLLLQGSNLLNQAYDSYEARPAPPRAAVLSLRLDWR